jgi:hypothetical protein
MIYESLKMTVFWDVAPYSLVEDGRRFRKITLMMETVSTSETSVSTRIDGSTSQKTHIFTIIALRT